MRGQLGQEDGLGRPALLPFRGELGYTARTMKAPVEQLIAILNQVSGLTQVVLSPSGTALDIPQMQVRVQLLPSGRERTVSSPPGWRTVMVCEDELAAPEDLLQRLDMALLSTEIAREE